MPLWNEDCEIRDLLSRNMPTRNPMNEKELHRKLAAQGIRIFALRLHGGAYQRDEMLWIHPNKTAEQWRADMKAFLETSTRTTDIFGDDDATDDVFNALYNHLRSLGYMEVVDVAADVYEGRVVSQRSHVAPDPDHEEDATGFGHFGWDARALDPKKPS